MDLTPEETERLERFVREIARRNGKVEMLDHVNERDRAELYRILKSRLNPDPEISKKLEKSAWGSVYAHRPVSVEQFVEDEFYIGQWYKQNLYEKWKEEIVHVINNDVIEWVLSGAIGIGKTSAAMLATMYKLYLVTCMRDPCAFYGCTSIVFGLFSVSLTLAQDVEAEMLITRLKESEYFRQVVGVSEDNLGGQKTRAKILKFPNNIKFAFGSQASHALGQDVYSAIVDEIAFSKSVGAKQVRNLYNGVKTRLESRFMTGTGRVPGILAVASSANVEGDFLDEHLQNSKVKDKVHISSFALYQMKSFPGARFRVLIGTKFYASRILDSVEKLPSGEYRVRPLDGRIPDEARVEEVPVAWYERFVEDIERSIRDICGISLFSASPFFAEQERIRVAFSDERPHPFTIDEPTLSLDDEEFSLESIFSRDEYFDEVDTFRHTYRPKVNPGAPRFLHIDLSKTQDCVGLACCHLYGFREVERPDLEGKPQKSSMPVVYVDFLLRVHPPVGSEIDFSKLTSFVFYLKDIGMPVGSVTFDQFQSTYHQQLFRKAGVESKEISMDRTPVAYQTLKAGILAECLKGYPYKPIIEELGGLQVTHTASGRIKVDHTPTGSKDVADALAGAHYAVVTSDYVKDRTAEMDIIESQLQKRRALKPQQNPRPSDWVASDYSDYDRVTDVLDWEGGEN